MNLSIPTTFLFALTVVCVHMLAGELSLSVEAAESPNFVWLISEDNSKHFLKLFDETGAETPRIAELAKDGLVFEHAFSNAPVCSVARTTLITGCYAPRIGTQFHRRSVLVPMPEGVKMFPAYLRTAGYYTTNKQKKDYNAIEGPDVWDESSKNASWRNRSDGQPFFHMQSFTTSHEGSLHFSKEKMDREPTRIDPKNVFIPPIHPQTDTFRYTYARYHDHIQSVDQQIGDVVDQLKKDGLLEDTFIFYFGDHGGVLPGSKGYARETGLHVPLVVRIPERWKHLVDGKKGDRVEGFVSFIDFGPTLLQLAGVEIPPGVDGRPFLGKDVKTDEVNERNEAFGYADRFDEKYDFVRTLRKGNLKYIRNYQPFNFDGLQNNYRYKMLAYQEWRSLYEAGQLNETQSQFFRDRAPEALYDLDNDPYETNNLAHDSQYADSLSKLRHRLQEIVGSLPDLSFFPESYLADEGFKNPVTFGQQQHERVKRLLAIADQSLLPRNEAKPKLMDSLNSQDPWERYWALISLSSLKDVSTDVVERVTTLAKGDPERLVRVRAAEYLGITSKSTEAAAIIIDALAESSSQVEACLILNTLVLLRDGESQMKFDLKVERLRKIRNMTGEVQRRMEYLLAP